ncbi:MAG TPA: TetR/AcrR family transcriptional regulator [Fimbriimonas sp.]|nr:TetR/AcrR family transcriptional regulator [Fimbriimonas sp.]
MSSLLSTDTRSKPLQERSARRIAHLLDAAASLIAESGYDALTMTAIAERAGASIGALYRWFPDKEAVAVALRSRYATELQDHWGPFVSGAQGLSVTEFSDGLIDRMVEFCDARPAYLPLVSAPVKFVRDPAARKKLRDAFVDAFQAFNPELSQEKASMMASVAIQVVKGLLALYGEAEPKARKSLTREFKKVLALYLADAVDKQ